MGKCKQRLIARAGNDKNRLNLTRKQALNKVITILAVTPSSVSAKNTITLFGFTAEELAEAGLSYEILRSLDYLICDYSRYTVGREQQA